MNIDERIRIINSIKSENTKSRKQFSFRSSETNAGRFSQFVKEHLLSQFFDRTVKEMPIISSINIQKAIVNKKATIYKKAPKRSFQGVSNQQAETLELIYKDAMINKKLNVANKNFCYQDQTIGMIFPKNGKLVCRIFKMHQIDAIPSLDDPESADGYIISAFDRTDYMQPYQEKANVDTATGFRPRSLRSASNQSESSEVSDEWDYKKYTEKYIVWTREHHFMMNGLGEVIDPDTGEAAPETDITSPLASEGVLPFFEVSGDKDFEYFVRPSNALTDFTIEFNAALSDLQNTIKMNGYAVGVLKAPSDLQPESQVIGAAMLLKLPTDNPEQEVSFEFVSPNASIGEISQSVDRLLNYFTTSEGLGTEVINSSGESRQFSSGLDRFIATVNRIEAHQDDYERFRSAENDIFDIIKAWLNVLNNSTDLDSKYKTGVISQDASIEVSFYQPEMILSENEKIEMIERKIGLGIMSQTEAIMESRGLTDKDEALKIREEINGETFGQGADQFERDEPNDQSEE